MSRRCPEGHGELREITMADQKVDRCSECGGIFFDAGELEAILTLMQTFNSVSVPEEDLPVAEHERAREVLCPHDGSAMEPRESGVAVLDLCPSCRGIWLDGGELTALKLAENNILENLSLYIRLGD